MFIHNWKTDVFTIPNFLSMFRLLLIPVYIVIYLHASEPFEYILAGTILAVSCLTDMIDGKVARHFNMISNLGKILDPIADKATQFAMILCLAMHHPVLWVVLGLFIVKEGFQLVVGVIHLRKGQMLTGALMEGKICTTVLFISLIALVLSPDEQGQGGTHRRREHRISDYLLCGIFPGLLREKYQGRGSESRCIKK